MFQYDLEPKVRVGGGREGGRERERERERKRESERERKRDIGTPHSVPIYIVTSTIKEGGKDCHG